MVDSRDILQRTPAHALDCPAVLKRLQSSMDGLSTGQAAERLRRYGPNLLPPPPRRGRFARFVSQFDNVVIYVLLGAAAMTALLRHWSDCSVIVGVVLINAIVGYIQEGKAEQAIASVRALLSRYALVRRDGRTLNVTAEDLVPGDIIMLKSGDKVPADARVLNLRELRIDESMLTGESQPVQKAIAAVAADAVLGDRECMIYSGTLVTLGRAVAIVTATGTDTEIGRISAMLEGVETLTTPLLRQLSVFGRWLTGVILAAGVLVFAIGVLWRGFAADDMFLAVVGLAVAAIPEGLPAIITITLAVGVQRMARRRAIIRRLPAVEALGAVTVICTDKTGTLTRNEMCVRRVLSGDGAGIEVTGAGYDPQGRFLQDGGELNPALRPDLWELSRAAVLCNDTSVHWEGKDRKITGDPTEVSLLVMGIKAGVEPRDLTHELPRLDAIPFESGHRFMATLHRGAEGRGRVYLKGAPEVVLERCTGQYSGNAISEPLRRDYWLEQVRVLGAAGQRTIALAFRDCDGMPDALHERDVSGMTLLGIVGISDPPRGEALEALSRCRSAGITVKMVTGDHAQTATAIAAEMGFPLEGGFITGGQLECMSPAELSQAAKTADVFARTSPEHKLRLVEALQAEGAIVAMTGDGVNDAPALKRADVGVAMGLKGTEVAREAAEIVLADDNFASIVNAVEEGRTVFDNITKSILYILPTSIGEALTIIAAVLLGVTLPVTAVQILWVNMVTTVTLALALAFEPPELNIMRRPPRDPAAPILNGFMVWRIALVSLLMVAAAFGLFMMEMKDSASVEAARTVAVNTLVVCEAAYLLNIRFFTASSLGARVLSGNPWIFVAVVLVMGLQFLFTYLPSLQAMFGTRAVDLNAWAMVAATGLVLFLIIEAEKWFIERRPVAGRRST